MGDERMDDKNCLSYWLPKLGQADVPTPRTEFFKTDFTAHDFLAERRKPEVAQFLTRLGGAGDALGYPVFLRTGHGSGKHDWTRTCFVPNREAMGDHVGALAEWSACAGFMGLPANVWAVRQMLPVKPYFHAFRGMPVVPERRYFVSGGEIASSAPYWPEDCFEWGMDCDDWQQRLQVMDLHIEGERDVADRLAQKVALAFASEGAWSVDLLLAENGWWVTDMALATCSWGCPASLRGGADDRDL